MTTINSSQHTMHSKVMKMLAWYVSRSVNQHEKKLIDTHLQSCVSCRIELKQQQRFAEKVKQSSDFELAPKQSFYALLWSDKSKPKTSIISTDKQYNKWSKT